MKLEYFATVPKGDLWRVVARNVGVVKGGRDIGHPKSWSEVRSNCNALATKLNTSMVRDLICEAEHVTKFGDDSAGELVDAAKWIAGNVPVSRMALKWVDAL